MAYSEEDKNNIFDSICNRIESGESVKTILKDKDMPSSQTFWKWLDEEEEKSNQYAKAIKSKKYIKAVRCRSNPKGSKASNISDYRISNAKKVNRKRFPNSNIYVFSIENTNYYKIGVSQNTDRRFRDIHNSMPFKLIVKINKKVNDAYSLETMLHDKFKHKYIKSEWFYLTSRDFFDLCNIINNN